MRCFLLEEMTCREQILSEEYMDFILSEDGGRRRLPVRPENLCSQQVGAGYEVVYLERAQAEPLNYERYPYNAIPSCYTLLDMDAMNQAGISQVQYYPTLGLTGKGVMVGFVDTGIDYTAQIFRNPDGSSRIAGIWDQTGQEGTPPEGLDYGSAYTGEQITQALRLEDPGKAVPVKDTLGHGTYVASLACGGADVPNRFQGAAPDAVLGVVKLKPAKDYLREFYGIRKGAVCYQENDIMLGVRYLRELAGGLELPLVLCIALGTSRGGHNGTGALAMLLRIFANYMNRGVVVGTGNEANERHHFRGKLNDMTDAKEVEIQVGSGVEAFSLELWTELPNLVSITVISPSGEALPSVSIRRGASFSYRFLFEKTEFYADNRILVELNNAQMIFLRFGTPAAGIWRIRTEPVRLSDGVFHMWLPVTEFLGGQVIFLESDPDTTLTEPSAAYDVITVSAYNGAENSVDIRSGRGYTRLETVKPDLAAPGVNVLGALPGGRFAARSGSSGAAAITAGACALLTEFLLEQNPAVGSDTGKLKGFLILGARQRPDIVYPDREWGYGTLDLYETLKTLRTL